MSTSKSAYSSRFKLNKTVLYCLMILPGAIWFFCMCYMPMFGLLLAFKRFHFSRGGFFTSFFNSEWIGFENFKYLFQSNEAWVITRNTVGYNILFIIFGTILSIALAIGFNELLNKRFAKVLQTLVFAPYFVTWVVIGYIVMSFLSFDHGLVNGMLKWFGVAPIQWYQIPSIWIPVIVLAQLWYIVGYTSIIYLAAIVGISRQLYEAAEIEGASKWQQIRYITIPGIKPIIIVMVLIAVGQIFVGNFGLFWFAPMQSGAVLSTTNVINTYMYRALMYSGNIGMSTATCLYQSVMGFILILVFNGLLRKYDKENAMF